MIRDHFEFIENNWESFGLGRCFPKKITFLMQSRRRVVFLLTDFQKQDHPFVVLKIERDPNRFPVVENYIALSQKLRAEVSDSLKRTIPISITKYTNCDDLLIISQGLPGKSIEVSSYKYHRFDEVLESCQGFLDWLMAIQAETYKKNESILVRPQRYQDRLHDLVQSKELQDKAEKIISTINNVQIPAGWRIGDMHPSNILFLQKKVSGFIDWEGIDQNKPFFCDWFQFILSLSMELIKGTNPRADVVERAVLASKLLFDDSPLGKGTQTATSFLFQQHGLDPEYIRPFYLIFLIKYYWFEQVGDLVTCLLQEWDNLPYLSALR